MTSKTGTSRTSKRRHSIFCATFNIEDIVKPKTESPVPTVP